MDLAELQRALAQNKQATQDLAGYNEDFARASALRDAPAPSINSYGTVSPLAIVANMMRKSHGRRDVRELGPLRKSARGKIADTTAILEGDKLRQAKLAEQQATETHNRNIAKSIQDQEESALKSESEIAAADAKLGENTDKAETWVNKAGEKISVVYDPNRMPKMLQNGQMVDVPPGYTKENTGYLGLSRRGKAISPNLLTEYANDGNQVRKIGRVVTNFKPSYIQPAGLPTETLNKLLLNATVADLTKYAKDPKLDQNAKDSIQWWADWRLNYDLIQRHKLFGATLTKNEMASWREAVALLVGMSPVEAKKRIDKLYGDLQKDLSNRSTTLRELRSGSANEVAALDGLMQRAGLPYNNSTSMYGVPTQNGDSPSPVDASADTPASDIPELPEQLGPEKQAIYGQIAQEIMADEIKGPKFQQLSPAGQRKYLDYLYSQGDNPQ